MRLKNMDNYLDGCLVTIVSEAIDENDGHKDITVRLEEDCKPYEKGDLVGVRQYNLDHKA